MRDILKIIKDLMPKERMKLFEKIRGLFCIRCGREIPTSDCNCWKH